MSEKGKSKAEKAEKLEKLTIQGMLFFMTEDPMESLISIYVNDLKTYREETLRFLSLETPMITFEQSRVYISDNIYKTVIEPMQVWINKQKILGIHQDIILILKNFEKDLAIEIYKPTKIKDNKIFIPRTLKNIELSIWGTMTGYKSIIIEDIDSMYMSDITICELLTHMHSHSLKMNNTGYIKFEAVIIKLLNQMVENINKLADPSTTDKDDKDILSETRSIFFENKLEIISSLIYAHIEELGKKPEETEETTKLVNNAIDLEIKIGDILAHAYAKKLAIPIGLADTVKSLIHIVETQMKIGKAELNKAGKRG